MWTRLIVGKTLDSVRLSLAGKNARCQAVPKISFLILLLSALIPTTVMHHVCALNGVLVKRLSCLRSCVSCTSELRLLLCARNRDSGANEFCTKFCLHVYTCSEKLSWIDRSYCAAAVCAVQNPWRILRANVKWSIERQYLQAISDRYS